MARFDKLCRYLGTLCNYKNVLTNRVLSVNQQQVATLKASTKDKLKNLKIPERPKRPMPPYISFVNEHRLDIKKNHPEWKVTDITKQCAKDWEEVDDARKRKLSETYNEELKVYTLQLRAYKEALTTEQADALKDARKERRAIKEHRDTKKLYREVDRPKRPMSSFVYYMKDKMLLSENKGKRYSEVLKICKGEWNALPEDKKKKYLDLHEKESIRYKREMELWEAKMIKDGNEDLIRKCSKVITTQPVDLPKSKRDLE